MRIFTFSRVSSRAFWTFILLICCCLPLAFITPPLQVPDEQQHFYRSYQISELKIFGQINENSAGDVLPSSLARMTENFLKSKFIHDLRPVYQYPMSDTLSYLSVPLNPDKREFIDFSSQIIYSPLAYIPQAFGVATARWMGGGVLALLYAGRFANVVFAILIISFALSKMPIGRAFVFAACLLPMTIYQIASVSADALVISCTYLYTAIALRGLVNRGWSTVEIITAAFAAIIFCTAKVVYLPIVFMALPALFLQPRNCRTLAFALAIPIAATAATLLWLYLVAPLVVIAEPRLQPNNASVQIRYILDHPLIILSVIKNTASHSLYYLKGVIGHLGWLSIPLSLGSYALVFLALGLCILAEPCNRFDLGAPVGFWFLVLAVASTALIGLALYLTWTPPGYHEVEGIQGRYFLPFLPMVFFALRSIVSVQLSPVQTYLARRSTCIILLSNVGYTIVLVSRSYGVFSQ